MRVSSALRIILIKEEKQRVLKKLDQCVYDNCVYTNYNKRKELEQYLKYIDEQLKLYPELK